jgi:type II secretory pathway pseudopilin PulG
MMTTMTRTENRRDPQSGMTLIAVMAVMAVMAIALLAVAPSVQQEVQREKELESIRRGEEIAEAIRQYVDFYRGAKLPESIDDLLEGLPQGTKKRMILRESSAVDPLSDDGKWLLVKPDPKTLATFARRVQIYNNGLIPGNPSPYLQRYSLAIANVIATETEENLAAPEDDTSQYSESDTPFIGVVSKSKSASVLAYYGLENHSKWIFTPLFRGSGITRVGGTDIRRPKRLFVP